MLTPDFQMAWHDGRDHPEWGSAPRHPLVQFDMAHKGEWLESVIGPDPRTGKPTIYYIVRCELCIGIHAWPFPDEEVLLRYYRAHFYQHEKPDYIARYEQDAEWWDRCMHRPLLHAMAFALLEQSMIPETILDIGAGPGLLLRTAQQVGLKTYAIEPSIPCAQRLAAAGHQVLQWEDGRVPAAHPLQGFDMVTLWEGLEHMICPEEMLLAIWDMLRPGGMLGLCVPNDYTPAQAAACARFGLPCWWLAPPQHLWYFTPKTLQLLVRRCGFTILDAWTTYPMIEQFILQDGLCYVGDDAMGRRCHQARMRIELDAMTSPEGYAAWMAKRRAQLPHRIGREIVMVARKDA